MTIFYTTLSFLSPKNRYLFRLQNSPTAPPNAFSKNILSFVGVADGEKSNFCVAGVRGPLGGGRGRNSGIIGQEGVLKPENLLLRAHIYCCPGKHSDNNINFSKVLGEGAPRPSLRERPGD